MTSIPRNGAGQGEGGACPSELALERWRTGEMQDEHERGSLALHLGGCVSCTARLAELSAPPPPLDLNAVWNDAHPQPPGMPTFTAIARTRRARTRVEPGVPRLRRLVLSFSLVAVAVGLLFYGPSHWPRFGERFDDLVKGTTPWAWRIVVKGRGDQRVRDLASGERLVPGDRLRFEVRTSWKEAWAAVLSFDGAGNVTPFVPAQGLALPAVARQASLLDAAIELDDTLGDERLELLGCREAVPVASLVDEGRAALVRARGDLHALDLRAPSCERQTFWIVKVKP
jgi:hypothetical protein